MSPDMGSYEERYRLTRRAKLGLAASLLALVIGVLAHGALPVLVTFLVIAGITALPAVIGPASRKIAFRADHAGITLGADPQDSWPFGRDPAVFVSWADVEQIIIYPRPGYPADGRAQCIGIQRRPTAPDLSEDNEPTPGCPVPRVITGTTRSITGWQLDRDRLAAVTASVAPGVPIIDTSTGPSPSIEGPASG